MKKVLLIALLTSAMAVCQNEEKRKYPGKGNIEICGGVGVNFSNVTNDDFDTDTATGFNLAFSTDYFFNDRWSIRGKIIYDQKGFDDVYYVDINGDGYPTNVNLNYLTIPVMANWHFGKKRQWYLNFGPYAAFLMSAKETEGGEDVKDGFNGSDFGLALGIGVKIPLNDQIKLFIEYEDSAGFSDVSEGDGTFRNTRGGFNIGLNFLLK